MNPDCRDGKHQACAGDGWDIEKDEPCPCNCSCHIKEETTVKENEIVDGIDDSNDPIQITEMDVVMRQNSTKSYVKLGTAFISKYEDRVEAHIILDKEGVAVDVGEFLTSNLVGALSIGGVAKASEVKSALAQNN